ncbi:MAG: type II toxin-antitoxin system HicA family toxin [Elusimicrobia bacterium]|nr:type II toxin-antitoxin system HicA family toxin [Elusimicrobiota bacterium]
MKRRELLRHLRSHGCGIVREGGRHSIVLNPATGRTSAVPRHAEVDDFLARKICRDLVVPEPWH